MKTEKQKLSLWMNKQSLISFVAGMAAMLILIVGVLSGVDPSFLTGTVKSNNNIVRYRIFPEKVNATNIDITEKYAGELSILCDPVTYMGFIDLYTKCDGKKLNSNDDSFLLAVLRGEYGFDGGNFNIPKYSSVDKYFDYYIKRTGYYPAPAENKKAIVKQGLKYILDEKSNVFDFYMSEINTAEIVLLSVPDNKSLNNLYLPCEGQTVKASDYPVLASIIAPYNETFKLPDLRERSPVEGAEYYIATIGLLPYEDQLPDRKVICRSCHNVITASYYVFNCYICGKQSN